MRVGVPRWMRRAPVVQSSELSGVSLAERAGRIRRFITEILIIVVALVLAFGIVRELRTDTISVMPVQVPDDVSDAQINSIAASQAIAQEMANLVATTPEVVSRPEGETKQRVLSGNVSMIPDIELPGQPVSFRSIVEFLEDVSRMTCGRIMGSRWLLFVRKTLIWPYFTVTLRSRPTGASHGLTLIAPTPLRPLRKWKPSVS